MTKRQSTASPQQSAVHATWLQFRRVRGGLAALVRTCGAVAIALGSIALVGWVVDLAQLRSGFAGTIEVVPNAALALILSGASLILAAAADHSPRKKLARRAAQALGGFVAVLGLMTAAEYFFEVDLGIDQALFRDTPDPFNSVAGRMSPYSAIAFALIGIALAALPAPKLRALTSIGAGCAAVIGLVSLTGYVWGVMDLLANEWTPPMAVYTAVSFLPLGAGTWLATFRYSKGKRSLRFLLDPIKLKIMGSFVGALLVLALMGGLTYGMATDAPRDARSLAAMHSDPQVHRSRQRALVINYLLLLSAAIVLGWVFAAIQREMRARAHAERALRRSSAEVERVSRARSAFLATMSHEIRTPMNGMLGMVELLGLSPLDARQLAALSVVSQSGQALLRIIDDILDLSKIEAGKLELREEVASLEAIVRSVQDIHSPLATDKGLEMQIVMAPELRPAAWMDPVRMRQILNNFASNAVKFTTKGRIEIRVDVPASDDATEWVRVSVTDTGIGIPVDEQHRLFQPFVQAAGGSGTTGGTGLGLAISRQLAELMGGTVKLVSEQGRGTTLSVEMRLRTAPVELLPAPLERQIEALRQVVESRRLAPTVAEAEADGTLVLLVDDHPVNRLLLQQQLESIGYAVEVAVDGHDALGRWRSGRFSLVLTDCQMPGLDGYELTRRIRQDEAAGPRPIPIIACTARVLEGEVDKCLQAGMSDVVFKPVELRQLLDKLDRWLPLAKPFTGKPPPPPEDWQPARLSTINTGYLAATWGSDPQALRRIVDSYISSARDDCFALREAMTGRDLNAVQQVAHRMLGASRMVGANGLAESSLLVSTARVDDDWKDITAGVRAVEAEFARLLAERGQAR